MHVLVIYQFCSFGGVERAILNRAKTFMKFGLDVHLSAGYLHDLGALESFARYIEAHSLSERVSAFVLDERLLSQLDKYDIVLNIDTPQIFEKALYRKNMFVECHTPYRENRQYLRKLPEDIKGVIVPSLAFKRLIEREFRSLPEVLVLPNPVTEEFYAVPQQGPSYYAKRPLAYLARLDDLKNYTEALDIFGEFVGQDDVMFAIAGKSSDEQGFCNLLRQKDMFKRTFLRFELAFDAVPAFLAMVKHHRGVFVSPSKGESFGLSAAEFMSAGVPVLLSRIDAHQELVDGDERFLYHLADVVEAKYKVRRLLEQWEWASGTIGGYARKFGGSSFIEAWQQIADWSE